MSLACFRRLGAIDVRSIILRRVLYLDHKGLTKKISPIVAADLLQSKIKKIIFTNLFTKIHQPLLKINEKIILTKSKSHFVKCFETFLLLLEDMIVY